MGALGEVEAAQHVAHLREMTAKLDDRGRLDAGEATLERALVEGRRDHGQRLLAGGERQAAGGRTGRQRGDARHDLDATTRGEAGKEIHERTLEKRMPPADDRNGVAQRRVRADLACRPDYRML